MASPQSNSASSQEQSSSFAYFDGSNVSFDHDYCVAYPQQPPRLQNMPNRKKYKVSRRKQIGRRRKKGRAKANIKEVKSQHLEPNQTQLPVAIESEWQCEGDTTSAPALSANNLGLLGIGHWQLKTEFKEENPETLICQEGQSEDVGDSFGNSFESDMIPSVNKEMVEMCIPPAEGTREVPYVMPSEEALVEEPPKKLPDVRVKFLKDVSVSEQVDWRSKSNRDRYKIIRFRMPKMKEKQKPVTILRMVKKPEVLLLKQADTTAAGSNHETPLIDLTEEDHLPLKRPAVMTAQSNVMPSQENTQVSPELPSSSAGWEKGGRVSVCRLCGKECLQWTKLFHPEDNGRILASKINFHLPILVREDDSLPQNVCDKCATAVTSFDKFYNSCLRVDFQLKKFLNETGALQDDRTPLVHSENAPCLKEKNTYSSPELFVTDLQNVSPTFVYSLQDSFQENVLVERSQVSKSKPKSDYLKTHSKSSQNNDPKMDVTLLSRHQLQFQCGQSSELAKSSNKENTITLSADSVNAVSGNANEIIGCSSVANGNFLQSAHTSILPTLKVQQNKSKKGEEVTKKIRKGQVQSTSKKSQKVKKKSIKTQPAKKKQAVRKNPNKTQSVGRAVLGNVVEGSKVNSDEAINGNSNNEEHNDYNFKSRSKTKDFKGRKLSIPRKTKSVSVPHTIVELSKHRKTHDEDVKFKCHDCGKVMRNESSYKSHRKTHTGIMLPCEICGKLLANKSSLGHHRQIMHGNGEDSFCCQICGKTVKTLSYLHRHMTVHSTEKPFCCSDCGVCFKTRATLKQHCLIHSDQPHNICDVCGHVFRRRSHLVLHMRVHSAGKSTRLLPCDARSPCRCKVCARGFKVHHLMVQHRTTMHSQKEILKSYDGTVSDYQCCHCDKVFECKISLQAHERHCTRKYACDICGQEVRSKRALVYHNRGHTGELPFTCQYCGKGFKGAELRERHERHHTGERPYKCNICGKAFFGITTLCQHKQTHGEKKFKCPTCSFVAVRAAAIRLHVRVHTGERPYGCKECDKAYKSSTDLRKHVLSFHKKTSESNQPSHDLTEQTDIIQSLAVEGLEVSSELNSLQ